MKELAGYETALASVLAAAPRPKVEPVFCLPGNPVSSFVTSVIFLLPYIRAFRGEARPAAPVIQIRIDAPLLRQGGLLHFVPAGSDGREYASTPRDCG